MSIAGEPREKCPEACVSALIADALVVQYAGNREGRGSIMRA